jgi:hypothetical protein
MRSSALAAAPSVEAEACTRGGRAATRPPLSYLYFGSSP